MCKVGKWVPGKMHEIDAATYHDAMKVVLGSNFCRSHPNNSNGR